MYCTHICVREFVNNGKHVALVTHTILHPTGHFVRLKHISNKSRLFLRILSHANSLNEKNRDDTVRILSSHFRGKFIR